MRIKELKFYIDAGEPATRQATNRDRGTMMKVPPGLSGLFTHAEGVRGRAPDADYFESVSYTHLTLPTNREV